MKASKGTVVCLGNFDGLHRGHQVILKTCLQAAKQHHLKSVLFTFKPHPRHVLKKENVQLLLPYDQKRELIQKIKLDYFVEQKFNKVFSQLSPQAFIEQILIHRLRARIVIVGQHFRFGHQAEGTIEDLKKRHEFTVKSVAPLRKFGKPVSSTWIRELIQRGKLEKAHALLGYPFFLSGRVIRGKGRGRMIHFPTANLQGDTECLPLPGVYFSILEDCKTHHYFCGATNMGQNPTFGDRRLSIETHLLHFEDQWVGRHTRLFLFKRIRSEKKFKSVEALVSQIQKDVEQCAHYFQTLNLWTPSKKIALDSLLYPPPATQKFQPFKIIENLS